MAFTPITVTRPYRTAELAPAVGTVRFTPSAPMHNGSTVVAAPVEDVLDGAGDLSIVVAANNDPATTPTGPSASYLVRERITGQPERNYYVTVPYDAAGGTVDLSTLTTAEVPPVVTYPAVGPQGPQGEPGVGPAGWSADAAGNVETVPRMSLGELALTSGDLWVSYFTARAAVTLGMLGMVSAADGPATPTLVRMGLFTVAVDDALTLVARTANDLTFGTGGFTASSRALATAGGFPATYALVPGTRYAIGLLQVAATAGSARFAGLVNEAMAPVVSRKVAGQTDIAATYSAVALGAASWQALYLFGTP